MTIIDLSQELFDKMPVYPGDPEVEIKKIHTLDREGWNLRQMTLTTHIGTHVNVPSHMTSNGKNLDAYTLESFIAPSLIYKEGIRYEKANGLLFRDQNVDQRIADMIIAHPPKFIGLASAFEFDTAIEKLLLEHGIISFENLENTDKLPDTFTFYGVPLRLSGTDGSPVRAYAIVK
ncbi:cyclase family protein [Candidatus Gottesmanbacteria bacterium]|nr:cyclase family protein [Candidatus Gottesmanbacteria bacterium]